MDYIRYFLDQLARLPSDYHNRLLDLIEEFGNKRYNQGWRDGNLSKRDKD